MSDSTSPETSVPLSSENSVVEGTLKALGDPTIVELPSGEIGWLAPHEAQGKREQDQDPAHVPPLQR